MTEEELIDRIDKLEKRVKELEDKINETQHRTLPRNILPNMVLKGIPLPGGQQFIPVIKA